LFGALSRILIYLFGPLSFSIHNTHCYCSPQRFWVAYLGLPLGTSILQMRRQRRQQPQRKKSKAKKRITNKQKFRKKENNTEEPRVALVALKYTIIQPHKKLECGREGVWKNCEIPCGLPRRRVKTLSIPGCRDYVPFAIH